MKWTVYLVSSAILAITLSACLESKKPSHDQVKCDSWEKVLLVDEWNRTLYLVQEGCSGLSNGLNVAVDLDVPQAGRTRLFAYADGSWDLRYSDLPSLPSASWADRDRLLISVGVVGAIYKKLDHAGDIRIDYRIGHILSEEPPAGQAKN